MQHALVLCSQRGVGKPLWKLVENSSPETGISGSVYAADAAGMLPLVVSHGDVEMDAMLSCKESRILQLSRSTTPRHAIGGAGLTPCQVPSSEPLAQRKQTTI